MAYYKIKNITGSLAKRHQNKDTELKVEYVVGLQKKIFNLPVGQELVLSCRTLPIQIHTLRLKGLVSVTEISENEFMKLQKPSAKKTSENTMDSEDDGQDQAKEKKKVKKKTSTDKSSTIFVRTDND